MPDPIISPEFPQNFEESANSALTMIKLNHVDDVDRSPRRIGGEGWKCRFLPSFAYRVEIVVYALCVCSEGVWQTV